MTKRQEEAQVLILESMIREQELKEAKARAEARIAQVQLAHVERTLAPVSVASRPITINVPSGSDPQTIAQTVHDCLASALEHAGA